MAQANMPAATGASPAAIPPFFGMSEASAAAVLGPDLFVVGCDQDNLLRVYRSDGTRVPTQPAGQQFNHLDLSAYAEIESGGKIDLEGAARTGNRIYWIGSHSANSEGQVRKHRRRLLATDLDYSAGPVPRLVPVGRPFKKLLEALEADDRFRAFGLAEAALAPAELPGGLNIEGLAATPAGELLIGFRNPLPGARALVVKLKNPAEVLEGEASPDLGRPILLDLGGRGIRSLDYVERLGAYLISAGPFGSVHQVDFRLYRWSGSRDEAPVALDFTMPGEGFAAEALVVLPRGQKPLGLLSDDGDRTKGLGADQLRFRVAWYDLPS